MAFIDIHSHILPNVDDGAKSTEEAIALLEQEKDNGVNAVICTPHFYTNVTDFDEHLKSVQTSFDLLSKQTAELGLPKLFLGYEVAWFLHISYAIDIEKCTLGGSNYLLLELPFSVPLSKEMLDDIEKLSEDIGFNVIIAHVERYSYDKLYKKLLTLIKNGTALAQVNADSLFSFQLKKKVEKLLKKNLVSFVGSDAHSLDKRPVKVARFLQHTKQYFPNAYERIISETDELLTTIGDCNNAKKQYS